MNIPMALTTKVAGIVLLVSSPVSMVLATSTSASAAATHSVAYASAKAPCIVTGYSLHASQEMAADGIGSDEVENLVYSGCSKAKKQSNGTFKYQNKKLVVICNQNGYVVTAWRL